MTNDHDSCYKFLFSTLELVRDLIIGFVPDEWLHSLDYTTLEKAPGSYVSEDFRHRADDIVDFSFYSKLQLISASPEVSSRTGHLQRWLGK